LASQAVPSPRADAAAEAPLSAVPRLGVGVGILAVAVPFLFLHESYQPNLSLAAGGTTIDASLADAAILAIVLAAIVAGRREGFGPLVPSKRLLAAVAALCVLCLAWVFLPVLRDDPYEWRTKLVAAAGFAEYALLVPALPLLLRTQRERRLFVTVLVATSVAATAWAILQFAGVVDELRGRRPAQREPSFVGTHDFSALSACVLAVALMALVTRERLVGRGWVIAAGIAGGIGTALAGAMTGVLGLWLAAGLLAAVGVTRYGAGKRQLLALFAIVLTVGAGAAATRGDAIEGFAEFLGINKVDTPGQVESYAQRTLLGYIGLRIFLDHPLIGSGFQASNDEFAFGPHLEAARDRFPGQPEVAFPSPEHPWGVQNLPIAALADFGVVGLALFLVVFGLGLQLGLRRTPTTIQLLGACWILVVGGVWNGLGVVPAIPLAALTWLGFGLAALDE
jgi:hypothetical protein